MTKPFKAMCLKLIRKRECCGENVQVCPLKPCHIGKPQHCVVEKEYDRPWKYRCQRCAKIIVEMPPELKGTRVNSTSLENAANGLAEILGRRPLDDPYYFDNQFRKYLILGSQVYLSIPVQREEARRARSRHSQGHRMSRNRKRFDIRPRWSAFAGRVPNGLSED